MSHRKTRTRVRANEPAPDSEATLQGIFRAAPVGIGMVSERVLLHVNDRVCEMIGRTRDELVGASARILYPSDEEFELVGREKYAQILEQGKGIVETRWQRKDGRVITVLLSSSPIDVSEPTKRVIFTALDVSERKQLEETIRHAKQEWESTFDTVRELVIIVDEELRAARVNRAVSDALGCAPQDLIGRPVAEILGQQYHLERTLRELAAARADSKELEIESETLGGEFRFTVTARRDAEGQAAGSILVGRDVTEQRRVEELLRRQEVVDQNEHIFRTFRHEIGNVLNTVKVTLSVMRKRFADITAEKQVEYLERCLDSVRRGERLLGAVRQYQFLDRVATGPLDLGLFLRERQDTLLEGARAANVECEVFTCQTGVWMEADPDALVRVLVNLIDNAVAATQGAQVRQLRLTCQAQPNWVILEVSDNGEGIREENLSQVLAPLYTTRPAGSGMGLAVVQKLMVRMRGLVRIRSEAGRGSVVELRFRRVPSPPS